MKRLLLLAALLLGLTLSASVQAQQSKLPPCPAVDYSKNTHFQRIAKWHNCYGRYIFEKSDGTKPSVYEGEFKGGKQHGKGTYTYHGGKYVGEYKDGKITFDEMCKVVASFM